MAHKIHYEDNLFYLHSILRALDAALRLSLDADLFRDKVVEDLFFLDATLKRIFASLKDNAFLLSRARYLRALRRTDVAFQDLLAALMRGTLGQGLPFSDYRERLESTSAGHQRITREIDSMLDELEGDPVADDVVSSAEIGFLLSDDLSDSDSSGRGR